MSFAFGGRLPLRDPDRRRRILTVVGVLVVVDLIIGALALVVIGFVGGDDPPKKDRAVLPAFVEPEKHYLAPAFERSARDNDLPLALLQALAWRESRWRAEALNPESGAVGIGQLLPATTAFVAGELLGDPMLDPADPQDNIKMTARYLRAQIESFGGDTRFALAAYSQGSTSVRNDGVSESTAGYLADIAEIRARFAAAARGDPGSALDPLSD
ncbi:MAG: lytic transglycosylase domain-containing protein [Actinobacteria bacterium]|nr:lytic transglycosylase domain-containing protein [Actinomycetota bacterium]